MRVGLMNLGDNPRVFHNKLNRAVLVPVGRVVATDLDERAVHALKHPTRPETVLVCEPEEAIPDEMVKVIELMTIIEFETHELALRKFNELVPPSNILFGDSLRPSRMQMRQYLRTMVEDFVASRATGEKIIRDDVDPRQLERELEEQQNQDPMHPLQKHRQEELRQRELNRRPIVPRAREASPPADPVAAMEQAVVQASRRGTAKAKRR